MNTQNGIINARFGIVNTQNGIVNTRFGIVNARFGDRELATSLIDRWVLAEPLTRPDWGPSTSPVTSSSLRRRFGTMLSAGDRPDSGSTRDTDRHEADLHPLPEGGTDALNHAERVAAVVGVLQTTDGRRRRADEFGEPFLAQLCLGPQAINVLGYFERGHAN